MSNDVITQILQQNKTIAVVGLSRKPERDSYQVAAYLQRHGYRIIPVNPRETGYGDSTLMPHSGMCRCCRHRRCVP
jgi:predicted CoA-binding protein